MRSRAGVRGGVAVAVAFVALAACVGDDPDVASSSSGGPRDDASVSSSSSSSSSSSGDASNGGLDDAGQDAAPPEFCSLRVAAGAAFCEDFEDGARSIAAKSADGDWDEIFDEGAITLAEQGSASRHSALTVLATGAQSNGEGVGFREARTFIDGRSKVTYEADIRFEIPSWNVDSDGWAPLELQLEGAPQDGSSGIFRVSLERGTGWSLTSVGHSTPIPELEAGVWHHVEMRVDLSESPVTDIVVTIDGDPHTHQAESTIASFTKVLVQARQIVTSYTAPPVRCSYDNVALTVP